MKISFGSLADHVAKRQTAEQSLRDKYGEDFDKASPIKFGLNVAEAKCIDDWYASLKPEILAIQKQQHADGIISDIISNGEPYYGAVGGGLTYSFTPTGLGPIIVVTESVTGKKLNVNDALGWFFYG